MKYVLIALRYIGSFIILAIGIAIWQCGLKWLEWCGAECDCFQVAINNFLVILQFTGKLLLIVSGGGFILIKVLSFLSTLDW